MKGIIIYKGKYGATKQYAAWLSDKLQLPALTPDELDEEHLSLFDFIILAGSIYVGKWTLREWVKDHVDLLGVKKVFSFIVCGTPSSMADEQKRLANTNMPISVYGESEIFFLPGRLVVSKLSWKDRIILKIGASVQKDPIKKKAMQQDVDLVSKDMLNEGIQQIRSFQYSRSVPSTVTRYKVVSQN
jgi:menaquinone-dependent protoporphyrinogen IX oxidase